MVGRTRKIVKLAAYARENLVEVPRPIQVGRVPDATLADRLCEERTEPAPPKTHRFVGDVDVALVEQILDVPKRHRRVDDFRQIN